MKLSRQMASALALIALWGASTTTVADDSYYERPALFSTRPSATKSSQTIQRFGPVGMGIELIQPTFTMKIHHIEEGSPAAATEKLEQGQIIESINGQRLSDIDPRIQLGRILAAAEATDGRLAFKIQGETEPIVVTVPVLGAYSDSWPLKCEKSDKIVRGLADYIASPEGNKGIGDIGMFFLISTGEKKDTEVVGQWARQAKPQTYAWYLGFGGIPLCEYYLRTGDQEVLPNIQKWVDNAVAGQYLDGWAGRGGVPRVTYGNGHLNAAGTAVVTFLLLAKECGADVPDHALLGALRHFYRYAGRGGNPYGDGRPEMGFVDNGKNGNLAFAMAAAAALTPNGEQSLYAQARDVCAITDFYTTTFMLHGHTGGGIGEIWRSASMGLMREKRPKQYREFMDNRRWHYDLSRRFDGSFGILGGGGYDDVKWGVAYGLAYTVPRKTLRITGAPPTKFSKPYKLPEQPWGTEADNDFLSLEAVPDANGRKQDLTGETLAHDSSMPFLRRFHGEDEVSDEMIRRYVHHQDATIRLTAASKALGINRGYIGWRKPGGEVRPQLVMEFLGSPSPRVRRAMFSAIAETLRKGDQTGVLTEEIFDLAVQSVEDPAESWWVKDAALHVIGHAPADWVVPHVDLLLPLLKHDEWWLQNATLKALTPVVADERCYRKVLPPIGELIRTNQRSALTLGMMGGLRERIKQGSPAVQQLAVETLQESYTGYAGVATAPGGQDIASTRDAHLEYIAASLADVPGGLDVLYEIARQRYPKKILPYKQFFLQADPDRFGPKLKKAIRPTITEELIPEFVGRNWKNLRQLAAGEVQSAMPGGPRDAIDGLVALYSRAGQGQYGWRMFVDLKDAEWFYHSFDPMKSERVPWDQLISRYREVTAPKGMDNWYALDFDPARAGWKRGQSPFGQYDGRLPRGPVSKCSAACVGPICYGAQGANTLWDKEVLLLRKTVSVPRLKSDHRYRLRVNHRAHVGNGGGFAVYVNGKLLIERPQGIGRGGGEKPYGAYITKEWLDEFQHGEVTIAVQSFLRYNDKYKVKPSKPIPQGLISVHLEQQKLPPMGEDLLRQSAAVVPMLSSEWQAKQDPDNREQGPDDHKFRWDGQFKPTRTVLGQWKTLGTVDSIDAFDPEKRLNAGRARIKALSLLGNGRTDNATRVWSGDTLMDLDRFEALKMKVESVEGEEYLFVEAGGFNHRRPADWKCQWYVMQREAK